MNGIINWADEMLYKMLYKMVDISHELNEATGLKEVYLNVKMSCYRVIRNTLHWFVNLKGA